MNLRIGGPRAAGATWLPRLACVEDLLRPRDVARMLGVSRTWLYEAAKDGRVPSIRIGGPGGPVRFVAAELEDWLAGCRQSVPEVAEVGGPTGRFSRA